MLRPWLGTTKTVTEVDPKMEIKDPDIQMRLAAFERVEKLSQVHERLTAKELKSGFMFEGERYPLVNPQRGDL